LFGVDLKMQQELLRHADIRTTLNINTQAVPAALREARFSDGVIVCALAGSKSRSKQEADEKRRA
jgi:site-specific recombinase XerD